MQECTIALMAGVVNIGGERCRRITLERNVERYGVGGRLTREEERGKGKEER
jgi:hypothetical protein